MAIVKSKPEEKIINGQVVIVSDKVVISTPTYQTQGESLIIVKDIDLSEIILETNLNCDHVQKYIEIYKNIV